MSDHFSPSQFDLYSYMSEDAGDFEDNYTVVRPPQFKLSTQSSGESSPSGSGALLKAAPATVQTPSRLASSYPAPKSTATVMADEVAAATQAALPQLQPRNSPAIPPRILYYVNRDYNEFVQPSLTEGAVAAFDHEYAHRSVIEWVRGGSQFSPADQMESSVSELLVPARTQTAARTGSTVESSWSKVSSPSLNSSQMGLALDDICATGVQFADVSAPIANLLLEEDCT